MAYRKLFLFRLPWFISKKFAGFLVFRDKHCVFFLIKVRQFFIEKMGNCSVRHLGPFRH